LRCELPRRIELARSGGIRKAGTEDRRLRIWSNIGAIIRGGNYDDFRWRLAKALERRK
jgi:hypothetical protein